MREPVDVLIIGAGAAGAAMAWSLAQTRMSILCLEQGDWPDPTTYPSTGRDWEARQFTDAHVSPNVRRNVADYPVNDTDSPIKIANFNGVGGGTVLYAGHVPRMHPSDFRVHTLDGVADDWPLDYTTLEPFYAMNDRMVGVASLEGDPAYPPKVAVMPPLPLGRTGRVLARGFNALGWHWWPSDGAIASVTYDGRPPCTNLGHCIAGCAQGAKGSADVSYWPHAIRSGVSLRTRCRVREITLDSRGMASGVVYHDVHGATHFQPARIVILACNGIGTPRLLLHSASAAFPEGLANTSGFVGRNLMLHPYATLRGTFDEPLDGYRGPHIGLWSHQFYETDAARGFLRGYIFQTSRGYGPVATAMSGLRAGDIPWGAGHHDAFLGAFNRTVGLAAICEDLPELHNFVALDAQVRDADGIPAACIHYTLSKNSRRMLAHAVERGTELLRASGAHTVTSEAPAPGAGWHLMGTARMGHNPGNSVVNAWGRCHDVRNLFIADGSIFVTAGGVNPTATIQALALYIADNIKRRLANLFD
ncbi:MAG: GMC family oxidoreductase [Rhodoferax sp.]|nr:GMC family oxidoreductase [Rhodoferax sp.]